MLHHGRFLPGHTAAFHMLAAIGEFERDLIKERAAEGIARAKAASMTAETSISGRKMVRFGRRQFDCNGSKLTVGVRFATRPPDLNQPKVLTIFRAQSA